jgi:hypothetical protein
MNRSRHYPQPVSGPRPGVRLHPAFLSLLGPLLAWALPAAAQAPEPPHATEEILRFAVIDPSETAFPDVGTMAVGPDGKMYLGLHHLRSIRIFEPDGTFLRAVGGAGRGDGQMGYLNLLRWTGDTLVVEDHGFSRAVYFDATGEPLGSADFGDGMTTRRVRALFGLEVEEIAPGEDVLVQRGERRLGWNSPYRFDALTARSPGGDRAAVLRMSEPGSGGAPVFSVSAVRAPAGETLFHVELPYTPLAIDPPEIVDALARGFSTAFEIPADELVDEIASQLELPEFAPPALDLAMGTDGTVWVRVWRTPGTPPWWMELDGEGQPARTIELPGSGTPVLFDGDRVYATVTIEGTLHLVAYRIDPGEP